MSKLELLKDHMHNMNLRIENIESEINTKKQNILSLNSQLNQIQTLLNSENEIYKKLLEQHEYLLEVQTTTKINYNQLEEAATTLLDILKSKCGDV
jgi:hypothetical protein